MDSSFLLTSLAATIGIFTLLRNLRFLKKDYNEKNNSSSSPPQSSIPPSSSLNRISTHHVFPSFRGEDVRRDFLSHIQMEFQRKGITPFIDNGIERGQFIGPELIRAIRGSKIAIILLSRNYASSSWCLDELAEIMKCKEELGQTVMAVFYKVDPSDVKKLAGDFGKVFKKTCARKSKDTIKRWTQALAKVATIAGYHSDNWDNEAAMVNKIATDISNKLNSSAQSSDFEDFVGMRAHLEKLEEMLCLDSNKVRMVGIWGPSGIGKTTIARATYNKLSNRFQLSVFMESVESKYTIPCSDDYSVKLHLQQQFMSQITNHKDMKISQLGVVQDRLNDKKVLVVLDGVNRLIQLDAMAKEVEWFGPGSRIIVTTQDQRLFRAHGINQIYRVGFPSTDEATQIFCLYAFGQKFPKDGFEELVREVTRFSGELPLGLRVMGSYFRGMSKQEWIKALPRLRTTLDADIQSILKFSYDALEDQYKELFLHIACFFVEVEIVKLEACLAETFVDVRHGLSILAEKALISIESGWITMHTLLCSLGRDIVRKQSIREPGQRQFLDDKREICELFIDDAADGRSVIGIHSGYNKKLEISERAFERMSNLQFLRFDAFDDIYHLHHGLKYLPRKLRILIWPFFPMTCFPSTFNSEFLVELNMPYSKLEKLWDGTRSLRNLKWMVLSYSANLIELPDLSTATNLQTLILSGCTSLVKLPSTIGYTKNLQPLHFSNYSSLINLSLIRSATILEEICLGGCSNLVELPLSIGNSLNLKILDLSSCSSLVELPSWIGNATNLEVLDLNSCSSLVELPSWIGNTTNLEELNLSHCSSLVELPLFIGNLQKLKRLKLQGCSKLQVLPTNINLDAISELDLTNCLLLKVFPEISTNIRVLNLKGTAIEEVPSSIKSWSRLTEVHMSYSENLKNFPHAFDIITALHVSNKETQELHLWVKRVSSLYELHLQGCSKLVSIPHLSESLSVVEAANCESLERLDCSFQQPFMRLNFAECFKLNQEARDLIIQTRTSDITILPGGEVPAFFTHRATTGGSLTVTLNERPLPIVMRFKACVLLVNKAGDHGGSDYLYIECNKSLRRLNPVLGEHLYIFEVEAEVTSNELVFEFEVDNNNHWKIGECGLLQVSKVEPWRSF